jgi:hypothetical protein
VSQMLKRAARAKPRPALLAAPEIAPAADHLPLGQRRGAPPECVAPLPRAAPDGHPLIQ